MMTRERTMEDYGELYVDIYSGQNIHIKKQGKKEVFSYNIK